MPEITVFENENAYLDFTLKYGPFYSTISKRGLPIPQTDTTDIFFYVSGTDSDAPFITQKVSTGKITWTDAINGKIRVSISTETSGHVGDSQYYELRANLVGAYMTLEKGTFNIRESFVDRP